MRQVLGSGALGRPCGMGWRGRWEGGSGWGIHVYPWLSKHEVKVTHIPQKAINFRLHVFKTLRFIARDREANLAVTRQSFLKPIIKMREKENCIYN